MTTNITIPRATLEQLVGALPRYEPEIFREDRIRMELDADGEWVKLSDVVEALTAGRAELEGAELVEPMTEVADRYAHRLALELECVLADRQGYYDKAMQVLGEYREAMNAIHERQSPTFMGEPLI